ncbi:Kdo hydroxylase family protein [Hyphomicrobium sp. 99]|uniref:Kdo hydroxylase family protein n=1 Tax=Hyphomicrobium sp. 99 TaxID=1163419 RepID=UPI0005F847A6|nr:Kdo hydroxylase family protein [Hyphomicrobium sp. 99]
MSSFESTRKVFSSLESFDATAWDGPFTSEDRERAVDGLESGRVLYFKNLPFSLEAQEKIFLSTTWSDQEAKNISFDPTEGRLRGARIEGADGDKLVGMMSRYASGARQFLHSLLPPYASTLRLARTSFRPHEVEGRPVQSYRKDDTRLHVDAFPSRPNRGARILRVFTNIHPAGKARVWQIGEPFEAYASRFLPTVSRPLPGLAQIESILGITKGVRTPYDHIMLHLHDRTKGDANYQREAPRQEVAFAAGSTWVVFTDQVLHAAISGQFVLEQTFELPVAAQCRAERSPLRVLERLTGRALAA